MQEVSIHKAKTHFSKLIDATMKGEEIVIAKAGKPAAKLVPFSKPSNRRFGLLKGKFKIAKDFDGPLSGKLLSSFE